MLKKVDIKTILRKNPQVDKRQLDVLQRLADELRALGIDRPGYRLASPVDCKRAKVDDTLDHRTIRLHRT